ncbi:diaminopimelate decarboxylase [Leifsonia sp. F6_8S_P_1B]|uniref:Diaminopimelate decarboxylase n=1 Tax=Leifsonia williamsii TaxID=3035919 RepID=A0ABT8KBZ1_9MICO|nr:diaminopimelate decarboxylase [Leifsonia williamsii]MDN4614682.1 diaminopimelate decarboxylase [Leifsonia williamsii]
MAPNPLAPAWLHVPDDANALATAVWPRTAARTDGELTVGGVGATELARRFGTPLYVIDEQEARERAAEVRDAFRTAFAEVGGAAKIYYAGKAFLSVEVARWMAEADLHVDVCSGGELAVALAAGVPAERLGFHGNNKSLAEIDRAVAVGVGAIIIDSLQEIDRVAEAAERHGRVQSVRLRVNSGVHAHTHAFLATAHEDQKFGITLEDAADAVARIRSHSGLLFMGLHCHIGSQIFGADGFAESAARLLTLHRELLAGGDVPELNLGGGFGIAYTAADDPAPIGELARRIAETVAAGCEELDIPLPVVAFEPGRSIIGTAGITLYTVGTTKDVSVAAASTESGDDGASAVRRYVSVDGGMSDNARTALYEAEYSARIASRTSTAAPELVRVAGKHCESGDIVVDAEYLPGDVAPGDLLAVPATGAYCFSLASNYNYLTRPPVVAVRDGRVRVIVRGETEEDLLSRDVGYTPSAPTPTTTTRSDDQR